MKILRCTAAAVVIFALAFTAFYGKTKIAESGVSALPAEYKGILTLWHIDTFEGGVGSRKQFLMSMSRDFEKRNTGVLVMATEHTVNSAKQAFNEGKRPDLISFGVGADVKDMRPLDIDLPAYGGVYGGVTYAVPWARGGYCVIENPDYVGNKKEKPPIIVSQGEYTNPLLAFLLSGKSETDFEILSPMDAYVKFVSGKVRYLLGTQRDINRLYTRGMDFVSSPLNGYNDLYQYIAITSVDPVKAEYCQKFVKFILSDDIQKNLHKIGMYSCYCRVEYDEPDMAAMQNAESGYFISAFSSAELIRDLQAKSRSVAAGNTGELTEIKKLIVS